jgi:hypothetical protein
MRRIAGAAILAALVGCQYSGFEEIHRVSDERAGQLVDKAEFPEYVPRAAPIAPSLV